LSKDNLSNIKHSRFTLLIETSVSCYSNPRVATNQKVDKKVETLTC